MMRSRRQSQKLIMFNCTKRNQNRERLSHQQNQKCRCLRRLAGHPTLSTRQQLKRTSKIDESAISSWCFSALSRAKVEGRVTAVKQPTAAAAAITLLWNWTSSKGSSIKEESLGTCGNNWLDPSREQFSKLPKVAMLPLAREAILEQVEQPICNMNRSRGASRPEILPAMWFYQSIISQTSIFSGADSGVPLLWCPRQDDFLLLVGYCGWGEGQLQGELNNQDTWTMASVDPKQLLGQLRQEQAELRRRKPGAVMGQRFPCHGR